MSAPPTGCDVHWIRYFVSFFFWKVICCSILCSHLCEILIINGPLYLCCFFVFKPPASASFLFCVTFFFSINIFQIGEFSWNESVSFSFYFFFVRFCSLGKMGLILLFFDAKVDDKSEHFVSMEYLYVVTVFCFLQNCSCFVSRGFDFTLLCLYRISCFSFCFCFFAVRLHFFNGSYESFYLFLFFFQNLADANSSSALFRETALSWSLNCDGALIFLRFFLS